jgi:hypothetical protein
MSRIKSDASVRLSYSDSRESELHLRVGWLERRQVVRTNLKKGDWKLAAFVYVLLAIIAAPLLQ